MTRLTGFIDGLNERLGRVVSWLALLMVMIQFIVVIQRYVFGIGSIWMQESIVYMHGMLFMLAAGYTLLHNGHVRVDVFYREATPRRKALTDLFGSLFFLLPCVPRSSGSLGHMYPAPGPSSKDRKKPAASMASIFSRASSSPLPSSWPYKASLWPSTVCASCLARKRRVKKLRRISSDGHC